MKPVLTILVALAVCGLAEPAMAQSKIEPFEGQGLTRPSVNGIPARLYASCYRDAGTPPTGNGTCGLGGEYSDFPSESWIQGTPIVGEFVAEGPAHPCPFDPEGEPFCVSIRAVGPMAVNSPDAKVYDSGASQNPATAVGQPPLSWLEGTAQVEATVGFPDWWYANPADNAPAYTVFNLIDPDDELRHWVFVIRFTGIVPPAPLSLIGEPPSATFAARSATIATRRSSHVARWSQHAGGHDWGYIYRNGTLMKRVDLGVRGWGYRSWRWTHTALRPGRYAMKVRVDTVSHGKTFRVERVVRRWTKR
jgi:hypothetical protein